MMEKNIETSSLGTVDSTYDTDMRTALKRSMNVIHAVILRDLRSRYFNHALGFLVAPLFPVAHVMLLLLIYTVVNRDAAFGDDLVLFFATGLTPVLTACYVSRYMTMSVLSNKSMLAFPAVKLMDIILARSVLEMFGIVVTISTVGLLLVLVGSDPVPNDLVNAVLALVAAACLGVGVGIIASVITAIYPFYAMVYGLFTVLVYVTSGGPIYLHVFPEVVVHAASYNPAFQVVEWMRSAYYPGYPTQYLDKQYLWGWVLCSTAVGLCMERLLRRQILKS